jgi:hypothetical protein
VSLPVLIRLRSGCGSVFATRAPIVGLAGTGKAAVFARSCLIDGQAATIEVSAVQGVDSGFSLRLVGHGNETKAAGTSAFAIGDQIGFSDRAVGTKGVLQIVFRGVEGKISYE